MGLIDRTMRIIRANINNLVSSAEDPQQILETTVNHMQDNLVQLRMAIAQAIATQKRTERQAAQAHTNAEEWHRRAQLALQQGNEPLAREALTKRKNCLETASSLQTQIEHQKTIVAKFKQDMQGLEAKVAEAKTKKDMYVTRAIAAQASANLNDMLNGATPNNSMTAFERMEEKVLQLEAQAEVSASLGKNDLESQFTALAGSDDVDVELAAIKAQLAAVNHNQKQLPTTPTDT